MKLDLGCGKNKKEGFIGVDIIQFDGVDVVADLGNAPWPWTDETVEEVHCSHMIEHLEPKERIHFVNELYRVMKKGAKALMIAPHWCSTRAYGDLTHKWPPICEFWFFYLNEEWRKINAPHNDGYKCNFEATWAYSIHPSIQTRNAEYQVYALSNFKEVAQDIIATMIKK